MVTLQTADKALKTLYLGVVSNQLNTSINPLFAKIKQTTSDVWGKEIRKLAPYGLNGGIGAGTETGDLPQSGQNNYAEFNLTLKNLFGTIEISDKAIRASQNSAGAFVNLLNAEMEGLIKAASFNFGRMLYGDGSGKLALIDTFDGGSYTADSVRNLMEGMIIDFLPGAAENIVNGKGARIIRINRANNSFTVDKNVTGLTNSVSYVTVQNSLNNELTGLGKVFDSTGSIYGLNKADYNWLVPYKDTESVSISDSVIQKAIDNIEETSGSSVNFLVCSAGVKRAYQDYLNTYRRNIDTMDLAGGYKAISYAGIPLISDRFCPAKTLYLLNTDEFTLHQLCDWAWLEGEDGKVIKQIAGKPTYTATLVKYADLICNQISGQGVLTSITES